MTFPTSLTTEIDYRLALYADTCADADAMDGEDPLTGDALMYQVLTDIEHSPVSCTSWNRCIMDWMIEKGVYRPITQAEYDSHTVMPAHRKSACFPKHRGVRHEFVQRLA